MTATLLPGSATLFSVEADTLGCSRTNHCGFTVRRGHPNHGRYDGEKCPRCEGGVLEMRYHQVDVAALSGWGRCSCENWQFKISGQLAKMTIDERTEQNAKMFQKNTCKHIKAARAAYALPANLTTLLRAVAQEREDGP